MFILYKIKRDIGREIVLDIDILKMGTEEECYKKAEQDMRDWCEDWEESLNKLKATSSAVVTAYPKEYAEEYEYKVNDI